MTAVTPTGSQRLRARLKEKAGFLVSARALTARALSIAASLFLTVAVARVLPPAEAGVFFVLLASITGAATLGRMGTDNMALKWVASTKALPRTEPRDLLVLAALASAAVSVAFVVVARWILDDHVPPHALTAASIAAAAAVVPAALSVTASAVLRAGGRIATGTIAELGSTQALAAVILLTYNVWADLTLLHVVYAFTAGHVVTAIWSVLAARNLLPDRRERADVRSTARAHAPRLLSMMGTSLMFYLLAWSAVLILGTVSTPESVAHFNAAARVAAFVSLIPAIQASYLTPQFARLFSDGRLRELNRLARVTTTRGSVVGLALAVPIALFPTEALLLFGEEYGTAADALRALAISALIVAMLGPVNGIMLTCGYEHVALALNGVLLVATAGGMFVVAPSAGATGVALISGVGSIIYGLVGAALLRRRGGIATYIALAPPSPTAHRERTDLTPSAGSVNDRDDGRPGAEAGSTLDAPAVGSPDGPRVLVVASAFAPAGGDPWLIDDLVEALRGQARQIDVVVYDALQPRPRGIQASGEHVRVLSVGADRTTPQGPKRLMQHALTAWRLRTGTRSFLGGEPYDLALFFSPGFLSAGLPGRLRRSGRVHHLTFVLWDFFPVHHAQIGRIRMGPLTRLLKLIERRAITPADTIAVMSRANETFLRRYHPGLPARVITVPPWGGQGPVRPEAPELDEFTVVFGGQLTAGRGVETLVEAAAFLQAQGSPAKILIIGSGPDRDHLQRGARSRGLTNLVFQERMSRAVYLETIARAHVGVAVTVPQVTIPSFPSKIVDYCRVGLPVITCLERSSDVGAIVEASGAGLAVEAGDAEALARAIIRLAEEHASGALRSRRERATAFYVEHLSAAGAARALLEGSRV